MKQLLYNLFQYSIWGLGWILLIPFAPIIGLIGILFYGIQTLRLLPKHRSLYRQTLFNGSRESYGRIPGQDYTQWNGKQITTYHRKLNLKGIYLHGAETQNFLVAESPIKTPFCTEEDLRWLEVEFLRYVDKAGLEEKLEKIQFSALALIPIFGVYAAICLFVGRTEPMSDGRFWDWWEALEFHIETCKKNLRKL